ncbi:MAG: FliM/FliN family flagellar motor switch protein [Dehalococcoidia bacterium]|nr:FliM/FliN family flagellar motor switch protein [Dehalococcoidia bacterium]
MEENPLLVIAPVADVHMPVEVELDRKIMNVAELLAMECGTVIKMTRSAGENIDIRVGGALVGFGEIVILEENMGVRITDFHEET